MEAAGRRGGEVSWKYLPANNDNNLRRITMKTKTLLAVAFVSALAATPALAQTGPKMKMTTDIPREITTPDSVETRLGTLKFRDGFPDDATIVLRQELETERDRVDEMTHG
jgi:hypothetical protein